MIAVAGSGMRRRPVIASGTLLTECTGLVFAAAEGRQERVPHVFDFYLTQRTLMPLPLLLLSVLGELTAAEKCRRKARVLSTPCVDDQYQPPSP